MNAIRTPAVAGSFYPEQPDVLERDVQALLHGAQQPAADAPVPKALIVPHAGYIYSGPIAANAYARLASARGRIKRVVLLGPAHRVAIAGLALPGVDGMQTPLGIVPIDAQAVAEIASLPQVVTSAEAHAREHALEVHLPFLQQVLGSFALVPLVVGRAPTEQVAEVIERLWGGDETLIVISSDLSHYLTYSQARSTDRETAHMILSRRAQLNHHQACGATPVNGLLSIALRRRLQPKLFDLRNSGDTAGDHSRVVGYASVGFFESPDAAGATDEGTRAADTRGDVLVPLARAAIGDIFGLVLPADESPAFLRDPGATFVTLTRKGRLRGCIGSLQAHRPLLQDVKANAKAAAFTDPRFEPLTQTEFATTCVEVSLLSAAQPLPAAATEAQALAQLRPGIDGLILEYASNRGTFLPQVWDSIPDPSEFLRQLKVKAGLQANFWADDIKMWRYTVVKYAEPEPPAILH